MSLRIMSFNANGIRAAQRKGFFDWFAQQNIDVLCVQETKAQEPQLDASHRPDGYHAYFFDAQKKGYSGVAIYSRIKPDHVHYGLDWPLADSEGRYIRADFGDLSVVSLYLPSGTSGDERQQVKFDLMAHYEQLLHEQLHSEREFIICGDWNIVHKEIDIKNFKSNQKNSGCLPEERAWLDKLFEQWGWVDAFRVVNQEPYQYTWWSQRGRARENNVGWRIDYQVVSPSLRDKVMGAEIYREQKFSDHAPLTLEYQL